MRSSELFRDEIKAVDGAGSGIDADLLDGKQSDTSSTPDTVPIRDADTAIAGKNQCTAWVDFDGADGTIGSSYNIDSITRDDTGEYTLTFSNEMLNSDYAVIISVEGTDTTDASAMVGRTMNGSKTTTSVKVKTTLVNNDGRSKQDYDSVSISIFGGTN